MRARPSDVVDLFVYVVVLNLAIEYLPSVISESFTLSLVTAALLKVALDVVILVIRPRSSAGCVLPPRGAPRSRLPCRYR